MKMDDWYSSALHCGGKVNNKAAQYLSLCDSMWGGCQLVCPTLGGGGGGRRGVTVNNKAPQCSVTV